MQRLRGACPVGAMELRDGEYAIDARRCLHCYCCAEFCPAGAVEVQGSLGALGALLRGRTTARGGR